MKTYSLPEVADQLCGDSSTQSVRWLADQIRAKRFKARKFRGRWRMSDADIELALEVCANDVQEACREEGPRVLSFSPSSARRRSA